jgi:hypothetical protein
VAPASDARARLAQPSMGASHVVIIKSFNDFLFSEKRSR